MEKIVKDVGDIQSRLIDHRPVLQGEIKFFIREECRLPESLNKMTSDTNEHDLPRCTESMHEKLCDALTQLEAANHMAQRIQQRELEAEQNTHMQVCAERRKQNWEEFLKEQSRLKEEVDEEHAKAVGRLSTQYNDMKKDLAKYSSF
uniref:Biogenesis of lysosome-related organelles complex 1 subunit 5 n=1 Tax=Sinocyclocheilus grahami TaxID=75366 RepID=A0A672MLG4_SINGR